ncbi:MAG: KH domain-containing protein [Nitrososphaerota archaeon]
MRIPWDLELSGGTVRVRRRVGSCELILSSPVQAGELVRILEGISRELERMEALESLRDAYWRVHHTLLEVIDRYWSEGRIEIDAEEGSVVIRALPDDAGRLVGRGGSTVSAVERETGLRIRIVAEGRRDIGKMRRDLSGLKDALMGDRL